MSLLLHPGGVVRNATKFSLCACEDGEHPDNGLYWENREDAAAKARYYPEGTTHLLQAVMTVTVVE